MYASPVTATSLPARFGYALVAFPVGAVLGYILMLKLLFKIGFLFQDPHPSMQGFGYFMMSLAAAATMAITASLFALTLPWIRPARSQGVVPRTIASAVFVLIAFFILAGQGHAPIFVFAVTGLLVGMLYITYVRHGVLDQSRIDRQVES
jgi:hypothetical protein